MPLFRQVAEPPSQQQGGNRRSESLLQVALTRGHRKNQGREKRREFNYVYDRSLRTMQPIRAAGGRYLSPVCWESQGREGTGKLLAGDGGRGDASRQDSRG